MIKLGIYIYNEWAFGSLHNGLVKELYKNGIYAQIFDWRTVYREEDFYHLASTFDYIMTPYGESVHHLINSYGYPSNRIISVIHSKIEIHQGIAYELDYKSLHSIGSVNPNFCSLLGPDVNAHFTPNGIHVDYFYSPISQGLHSLGYAGRIKTLNHQGDDVKRGHLVNTVSESVGLPLIRLDEIHFAGMPSFYRKFDCLMVSSNDDEACGLPFMEAAAAGRMVMGTNVGALMISEGNGGCILPMDEEGFVEGATRLISFFQSHPDSYRQKCRAIQDYARHHYDWSHVIHRWLELF